MYIMCIVKKLSQTYIVKYSIHIIIVRKQKNALAGTPTTAIFLAAILHTSKFFSI